MKSKVYYVYILASKRNGTLYVGVTSNLENRILQHRNEKYDGFTKKYNIKNLVYFEIYYEVRNAIKREKQIKSGNRAKKVILIENKNNDWHDLFDEYINGKDLS